MRVKSQNQLYGWIDGFMIACSPNLSFISAKPIYDNKQRITQNGMVTRRYAGGRRLYF
ncbi:hypothetical protein M2371_001139 [Buttiauxella sp. BIGb0471]|nr:hypothetical protein [Buttiauxella sp. BIGb0471]